MRSSRSANDAEERIAKFRDPNKPYDCEVGHGEHM